MSHFFKDFLYFSTSIFHPVCLLKTFFKGVYQWNNKKSYSGQEAETWVYLGVLTFMFCKFIKFKVACNANIFVFEKFCIYQRVWKCNNHTTIEAQKSKNIEMRKKVSNIGSYWLNHIDWVTLTESYWLSHIDWVILNWDWMDWVITDWVRIDWVRMDWVRMDWVRMDWVSLSQ